MLKIGFRAEEEESSLDFSLDFVEEVLADAWCKRAKRSEVALGISEYWKRGKRKKVSAEFLEFD